MIVKEFLKNIDLDIVLKKFKEIYKVERKDLKTNLKKFLNNLQTIKSNSLSEQGIILVKKYSEIDEDTGDLNIYTHSHLIFPDDDITYAFFTEDWDKLLQHEVVIEDGVSKEDAYTNIIFEMTYFGTEKESREKRIKLLQGINA